MSAISNGLANGDSMDHGSDDGFMVLMEGGGPWGFSLQGGADFRSPLKISRVGSHGKAVQAGLTAGNIVLTINGRSTEGLKHYEALSLIKTSGDTLELHCTKNKPRISSPSLEGPPKFFFPTSPTSPSAGKSSTLGRVRPASLSQSVPIPAHPMRPRSSSDAKKPVKQIAGIPVPAPPPSYRSHSHKHSTGSDSISTSSLSPREMESPNSSWEVNHQPQLGTVTSPADVVVPPAGTPTGEQGTVSTETPTGEEGTTVSADTQDASDAQAETEALDESFEEKRKVAAKGRISGWFDSQMKAAQQQQNVGVNQNSEEQPTDSIPAVHVNTQSETVKTDLTKKNVESIIPTERPPLPTASNSEKRERRGVSDEDSSDGGIGLLSSSGGGDWYKQMFQSLKQNVDDQFPDRKKVWDRSPTPVRKSSYDFKSNSEINTSSAKPATYGQTHRSSWTHSAHARSSSYGDESSTGPPVVGGTSPKRMSRPSSSSTIGEQQRQEVSPNMVFRRTSSGHICGSSVVYRKNSPSYNNSRDYWKQLERKNSRESLPNARSSLPRGRSLSTSSTQSDTGASEQPIIEVTGQSGPWEPIVATPPASPQPEVAATVEEKSAQDNTESSTNQIDLADLETAGVKSPIPDRCASANSSSRTTTPEVGEVMSKLHPILQLEPSDDTSEQTHVENSSGDVFSRIDPTKLSNALGNAVTIGTMEQEGASPLVLQSAALLAGSPQQPVQQQQPKKKQKVHKPPPGEKAKALHDFVAANEKELSFKKGDVLTLTRTVDQNWLEGSHDGRTGLFPINFVKVLSKEEIAMLDEEEQQEEQKEPEQVPEQPLNQLAKAKYDFTASTPRELTFKKGDVITLVKQLDDNWYRGHTEEGEEGIVPVSYIQLLEENTDQ